MEGCSLCTTMLHFGQESLLVLLFGITHVVLTAWATNFLEVSNLFNHFGHMYSQFLYTEDYMFFLYFSSAKLLDYHLCKLDVTRILMVCKVRVKRFWIYRSYVVVAGGHWDLINSVTTKLVCACDRFETLLCWWHCYGGRPKRNTLFSVDLCLFWNQSFHSRFA